MTDEVMYSAAVLRQFEARQSSDDLKSDLELTCVACEEHLCDIEAGDVIEALVSLIADHACPARWWVIEGDDHEQRVVWGETESEALDRACDDFYDQYGKYNPDLLTVLGNFDSEEAAQAVYPDAS